MLAFLELLIGVVVIVGVARYIIKVNSATGVLFVGGLTLADRALWVIRFYPPAASDRYTATDMWNICTLLMSAAAIWA